MIILSHLPIKPLDYSFEKKFNCCEEISTTWPENGRQKSLFEATNFRHNEKKAVHTLYTTMEPKIFSSRIGISKFILFDEMFLSSGVVSKSAIFSGPYCLIY